MRYTYIAGFALILVLVSALSADAAPLIIENRVGSSTNSSLDPCATTLVVFMFDNGLDTAVWDFNVTGGNTTKEVDLTC